MSWAEVKKLNSDLSTPLNILATIQHIDMVGENYVGYGDLKGTADILATDALYNHMIAKTILGDLVSSQNTVALAVAENDMALQRILVDVDIKMSMASAIADYSDVALAVAENDMALQKILADADIKSDMGTAIKDYNDVALAVAENDTAINICLSDVDLSPLVITQLVFKDYCETKLSASAGVGEWLAFIADSDNATLIACTDMAAVAASETAMTAVIASSAACTAIRNSATAITALDNSSPITVPKMTSNTAPSGKANASSIANATLEAWRAFNKINPSASDAWVSATGSSTNQWIEYEFTSPVWVYRLSYEERVEALDQTFKDSKLQYYNGSTWVDAYSFQPQKTSGLQKFTVASDTGKHTRWRVFVSNVWGGVAAACGELEFYGK